MTDNDKMREATTAATKIVTNPHGYTETSVLVAKAFLEQAEQSVPHEIEQAYVEIANELGCKPDNEEMLEAIYTLKQNRFMVPKGCNSFGLDISYFVRKMRRIIGGIGSYKPDEFARECARMAVTADAAVLRESEFVATAQAEQSEAVPVVGEVVAWRWRYAQKSEDALATACFDKPQWESDMVFDGIPSDEAIQRVLLKGFVPEYLYRKPTHSITAAELDRLQEGEACAETVLEAALVKFPDAPTEFECIGKMAAEVVRRYDAELERLKHCHELLKEARNDVVETLNCMRTSYRDSPRNKTRLDKQCEFLKQIDAAIAAGEKK